jgi:hypothetical protein
MFEPINNATPQDAETRCRRIARLAYEKWLTRGESSRTALQDWVEAEREIDSEMLIAEPPTHICRTQMPADDVLI